MESEQIQNLRAFILKMQKYVDPDQPCCSSTTGGDYYIEDALTDLQYVSDRLDDLGNSFSS